MTTNYSNTHAGHIASDLRDRREHAGLTRARLAGLAGCSPTSLANIEDGAIPKRSEVLKRALAVLDRHEEATAP
ncbi:MAG: helix-turn-helix domain-containing protein [Solirubrobacteraceae bacterium]